MKAAAVTKSVKTLMIISAIGISPFLYFPPGDPQEQTDNRRTTSPSRTIVSHMAAGSNRLILHSFGIFDLFLTKAYKK
jgi:hypothetical protein